MKSGAYIIVAIGFVIAGAGFLLPFWPLIVCGVLFLALMGRPLFAIALGLLIDLAYGAPSGTLHLLVFPFALVAIAGIAAREAGKRYFMDASSGDTV